MRIFAYSESIYNHCFVCDLDHLPGVGVIPLLLSRTYIDIENIKMYIDVRIVWHWPGLCWR